MLKPFKDRVVLKQKESSSKKIGNIEINEGQKPLIATVIAVGPDTNDVFEGDTVAYTKFAAVPIDDGYDKYLVIKACDILGRIYEANK